MVDLLTWLSSQGDPIKIVSQLSGLSIYPRSLVADGGSLFFLGRSGTARQLGILTQTNREPGFDLRIHTLSIMGRPMTLGLGELSHVNAVALRARLPFTAPVPVGVTKSAGLGDRLGVATPGHIRALRRVTGIFPVLAQQSIREMERTQRTPVDVMDDAMWGVFQEGWRSGYGADADHLKTEADIDSCVAAGFTNFTFDPRDQVDNEAETDTLETLKRKFEALPWGRLSSTPAQTRAAYIGHTWTLAPGQEIALDEEHLLRAACKYGHGIAHIVTLYRHLEHAMGGKAWELEISVDETDTPTRAEEHFYVASELKRLGVKWSSLAPRYVGSFEKGVDYIGDLREFEAYFARQVAIAKALGPYKLSLHSGSDKFSIYPLVARLAGNLVHLKTAGTSYLEALRAVAQVDPRFFREILRFAIANYERERVTYRVSGRLDRMPDPDRLTDSALAATLDQFDARQALHVTFGAVMTALVADGIYLFRDRLLEVLRSDEEAHYAALESHILKHIEPFSD